MIRKPTSFHDCERGNPVSATGVSYNLVAVVLNGLFESKSDKCSHNPEVVGQVLWWHTISQQQNFLKQKVQLPQKRTHLFHIMYRTIHCCKRMCMSFHFGCRVHCFGRGWKRRDHSLRDKTKRKQNMNCNIYAFFLWCTVSVWTVPLSHKP